MRADATSIPMHLGSARLHALQDGELQLAYAQAEDVVRSYDDSPNTKKFDGIRASSEPDVSCMKKQNVARICR